MIEIDWERTLDWGTFIVAVLGLLAAAWATRYSRLGYLLQLRQEKAAPTGTKVDDQELYVLRLIEERGPMKIDTYREEVGDPRPKVSAWCLTAEGQCVRGVEYAPSNKAFLDTLTVRLPNRGLVEISGSKGATLTADGRTVYRKEKDRKIAESTLDWLPMVKR